jgi:hypothetical protein
MSRGDDIARAPTTRIVRGREFGAFGLRKARGLSCSTPLYLASLCEHGAMLGLPPALRRAVGAGDGAEFHARPAERPHRRGRRAAATTARPLAAASLATTIPMHRTASAALWPSAAIATFELFDTRGVSTVGVDRYLALPLWAKILQKDNIPFSFDHWQGLTY